MLDIVCYAPEKYVSPTVRPGFPSNLDLVQFANVYLQITCNFAGTIINSVDRIYDCLESDHHHHLLAFGKRHLGLRTGRPSLSNDLLAGASVLDLRFFVSFGSLDKIEN